MPVIVIAPHDHVFEKTVSNMQEVAARGGRIILLTDERGAAEAAIETVATIVLPDLAPEIAPLVYSDPGAAPRLPYGGGARHGCRPAAQSGEVGHRRIGARSAGLASLAGTRLLIDT